MAGRACQRFGRGRPPLHASRDSLHVRRVPEAGAHVPRPRRRRHHPRRGAARPGARLRRRFLHGLHGPRPAVLRRVHESGALGPRLRELDRGLRARRRGVRERRGHAARLQPGDAASQRERPARAAHRLPQPRRSPQRSRDEALLLPPRDRAPGGGRRAPHLLLAAAAGLAQSRHLPHERGSQPRRGRPLGPEPRDSQPLHLGRQPVHLARSRATRRSPSLPSPSARRATSPG